MVRQILIRFLCCAFSLQSGLIAWGTPPGGFDPGFNGTGKVENPFPGMCITANDLKIQNDGKILIAGYDSSRGDQDYFIARFQADGRLDLPFGCRKDRPGFLVESDWAFDEFTELAVQSDGKILAVGNTGLKKSEKVLVLYRFRVNGTLDFSFGLFGRAKYEKKIQGDEFATCVLVLPSGRIAVGGYTDSKYDRANQRFLHYFTSDGNYETSVVFSYDRKNGTISDIALQDDGKIVGVGINQYSNYWPCVFRISSDGKADESFHQSGFVDVRLNCTLSSVAVGKNNKILACGSLGHDFNVYPIVVRLSARGDVDMDFYKNWVSNRHAEYMNRLDAEETEISIAADGKIVVCGFVHCNYFFQKNLYPDDSAECDLIVNRYTADGKSDMSFGDTFGQKRLKLAHQFAYKPSLGIDSAGGIVLLAKITNAVPEKDSLFALVKLVP